MAIIIGAVVGLACGVGSALSNRVWGTVWAMTPIAAWLVAFVVAARGGISPGESSWLSLSMIGVLLGLFVGVIATRRRDHREG